MTDDYDDSYLKLDASKVGDHRRDRQGRDREVQHPGQGRRALRPREDRGHRGSRHRRDREGRPAADGPQGLQRVRRA